MPDVLLAIKPHPAETPDVYAAVAGVAERPRARGIGGAARCSPPRRVLVTVNSTVAVDALSVGVPALVIGLPNNLTPFVDARVMARRASEEEIHSMLSRLLYDEGFRGSLALASRDFPTSESVRSGRRAAERTADAVIALTSAPRHSGPTLD